jgi:hypothetical protein
MIARSRAKPEFSLQQPMFWVGFSMFLINRYTDHTYNIPITDLFLPVYTGFMAIRTRHFMNMFSIPGLWLTLILMTWIALSSIANGIPMSEQVRYSIVVLTTFLPIFFYMVIVDRRRVMQFIIGQITAFGIAFIVSSGIDYWNGEVDRSLRGIQPTPVVALSLYICFGKRLSPSLRHALMASGVISFLVGIAIEARGPLLSIVMGVGFWLAGRFVSMRNTFLPTACIALFTAHYVLGLFFNAYQLVNNSDHATLSNLERAYAIDFSVDSISQHPLFGISPVAFGPAFVTGLKALHNVYGVAQEVQSPHNSFLEYTTFYGFPGGVLFLICVWALLYSGARNSRAGPFVVALCMAAVVRLAAFYGISGWIRIEWFTAMFVLFYDFRTSPFRKTVVTPHGRMLSTESILNAGVLDARQTASHGPDHGTAGVATAPSAISQQRVTLHRESGGDALR